MARLANSSRGPTQRYTAGSATAEHTYQREVARARVFVEAIFRGQHARLGSSVEGGAVVFVQRLTKTLSVYPHLHVLVLDGGYTEGDDGAVEFHEDPGPSAEAREAIEDEVESRLSGWLGRRGYLDETPEARPDDGWWLSASPEPSGASGGGARRLRSRFEVHTRVRVRADEHAGRSQLIRSVARAPFAEAQLEVIDEEHVRFTFRSPSGSGQHEWVLHHSRCCVVWRVAGQGRWFGAQKFEPVERVPYREAWAKLLARVYDVDGHACPRCPGRLRPYGAVLPPHLAAWVRRGQFVPVESTGPPSRQARLPFAS